MSIEAALSRGRAAALARMTSTATVRRKTGATTQDESTGRTVAVWADVHTDTPFRLAGANSGAGRSRSLDVAGVQFEQAVRVGNFAYDTADLADDDYIEITAGENAGRVLRIIEATWQDQATARRVPVEEVDRPEEWA